MNAMIGNGIYRCGCQVFQTGTGNLGISWCAMHEAASPRCAAHPHVTPRCPACAGARGGSKKSEAKARAAQRNARLRYEP